MVAPQGPHSTRAASENGATEFTNCSRGTSPMTAIVPSTYRSVAMAIPRMVERGMVRFGLVTSPAGTVAELQAEDMRTS